MTGAIHQVVPVLSERDATGHHALLVQQLLHEQGWDSEIFVDQPTDDTADRTHPLTTYDRLAGRGATLLYQCSVGSEAALWCRDRRERLVVNYHNITPARFFDAWHAGLAAALRRGRRDLAAMAERTDLAICDSGYNARELIELGYRCATVAPVLVDLDALRPAAEGAPPGDAAGACAPPAEDPVADPGRDTERQEVVWLCVGRLVPNKGQHDLLAAFAAWCAVTGRRGRLRLVGGGQTLRYQAALQALASDLGIADRVRFEGSITHTELTAAYRDADVFVSLSEHEGFCVPVIEAMRLGLPVVALGAAAVPETVGEAGIILPTKQPFDVAAAVERMVTDPQLRRELVRRGWARALHFGLDRTRATFLGALAPVMER